MNIGVDKDGTLTKMEKFTKKYFLNFCHTFNVPAEYPQEDLYNLDEMYNAPKGTEEMFWKITSDLYNSWPSKIDSNDVIDRLIAKGHKIFIITNDNDVNKQWFTRNNIHYHNLIVANGNKLNAIKQYNIELMFEDSPQQILDISKKIPVIKMYAMYNRYVKGNNIYPVWEWYHVPALIREQFNLEV